MSALRDMLVVGGGPAGAALAIGLARKGRDVVLVEREAGPHDKVCGEFLSGEALGALEALEVDAAELGAVEIREVRLSLGEAQVAAPLPFRAASLSRRRLDEALLARAGAAGAEIRRGTAVRSLARDGGGWRARLAGDADILARQTALATGKHDLRGWTRPAGRQNDLIGFKNRLRLRPATAAAIDGAVEIALFPGGYAGLEPIEDGSANLCLVVREETFSRLGHEWGALLAWIGRAAPAFVDRIAEAEGLHDRPLATARIPYGLVVAEAGGPLRLGDQAAVIPSLAGEGVSLALASGRRAAAAIMEESDADGFQRDFAAAARRPVGLASLVSRLIVRPPTQRLAFAAARAAPGLLPLLGRATRLSGSLAMERGRTAR